MKGAHTMVQNTHTQPVRDKAKDRERIEHMYLTRQITKEEFKRWLEAGGHNEGNR